MNIFDALRGYGYIGIFLVNLIGSATIFLPIPSAAFVFTSGIFLNPLLVGIIGGLGSAIGEFTGYALGLGGRVALKKRWKKQIDNIEKLFEKYGWFFVIFIFAATPLPDDIAGIAAGILKYPVKKYFLAVLIGKIVLHLVIAYAGFYGLHWILHYFRA